MNDKHVDTMLANLTLAISDERKGWSKFAATAFAEQAKTLRIRENVERFLAQGEEEQGKNPDNHQR